MRVSVPQLELFQIVSRRAAQLKCSSEGLLLLLIGLCTSTTNEDNLVAILALSISVADAKAFPLLAY